MHDDSSAEPRPTRRRSLRLLGAAATTGVVGALAGCNGGGDGNGDGDGVYVLSFHWGFRLLDAEGTVLDEIEAATGDDLTMQVVNVEPIAAGEDFDVPDAVYDAAESNYEDWETASLERIAGQTDRSLGEWESELESAEDQYPDHGLGVISPGGDILSTTNLPASMGSPASVSLTVDAEGTYDFQCTTYCGEGHPYMVLNEAIVTS